MNGEKWWSFGKKKKYKYEEEDDDDNALVDKRWVPLKWKVDKTLFTFSYKCLLKANTSCHMIADIYISISMETFEHRKYKNRGEDGNK